MKVIQFLITLNQRMKNHQIHAFAGQMAFFFVLSFFPLLIFTLSLISKLNINYDFVVEAFRRFLPQNISFLITDFIDQTITVKGTAVVSISGLTMLYSASRAVGALQRAVNTSYELVESRNPIWVKFIGIFYTFLFTVIIVLSLIIPALAKRLIEFTASAMMLDVDGRVVGFFHTVRNVLLILSFIVAIMSIYAVLPNKKMHLKDTYPGALFAILGSLATNFAFSKVVVSLTDYSILYGSLSAMIAFMIWVYFLSQIIIIGAEINAMVIAKRGIKYDNL